MNKAATLDDQEARHKKQACQHLAEAQRILRELTDERRRLSRRRAARTSLTDEVKAILQGA